MKDQSLLTPGPRHRDHDGWLPRKLLPLVMLATFVLVLACLYWGQAVFMPLALATVLTFLLHPVVTWLERRIGRVLSIVLVVALASTAPTGQEWLGVAPPAVIGVGCCWLA